MQYVKLLSYLDFVGGYGLFQKGNFSPWRKEEDEPTTGKSTEGLQFGETHWGYQKPLDAKVATLARGNFESINLITSIQITDNFS